MSGPEGDLRAREDAEEVSSAIEALMELARRAIESEDPGAAQDVLHESEPTFQLLRIRAAVSSASVPSSTQLATLATISRGQDATAMLAALVLGDLTRDKRPKRAAEAYGKARRLARKLGNLPVEKRASLDLAAAFARTNRVSAAATTLDEAIALSVNTEHPDPAYFAAANLERGTLLMGSGSPDKAINYVLNAVKGFDNLGDSAGRLRALEALVDLRAANRDGELVLSAINLGRSVLTRDESRDLAALLLHAARSSLEAGRSDLTERFLDDAIREQRIADPLTAAWLAFEGAAMLRAGGLSAPAARYLDAAASLFVQADDRHAAALARVMGAHAHRAAGELDAWRAALGDPILSDDHSDRFLRAMVTLERAHRARDVGRSQEAVALLSAAISDAEALGQTSLQAEASSLRDILNESLASGFDVPVPIAGFGSPGAMLIILSGPSGVGKDTVVEALRQLPGGESRHYVVTCTTRTRRPSEVDGVHYQFLSEDEFLRIREAGGLLEANQVHGQWYGTPRSQVRDALRSGRDVILKIDVQGAAEVKQQVPEALLIFLVPPSLEDLFQRLQQRATESASELDIRQRNATAELARQDDFDHIVTNETGNVAETARRIDDIIRTAKLSRGEVVTRV